MTDRGRLYIMFWTLLGLVITGIVTGNLSSALSTGQIVSIKAEFGDYKVILKAGNLISADIKNYKVAVFV